METSFFKPKNKISNKNCLDCFERALFIVFTLKTPQRCKKPVQKEKLQSSERNVCVRQTCFSAICLLRRNYGADFPNNPHSKQDPQHLRQRRSWTKASGQTRLQCLFAFVTNIKERRSPGVEVA